MEIDDAGSTGKAWMSEHGTELVEEVNPEELPDVSKPKPDISALTQFIKRTEAMVPLAVLGVFLLLFVGFLLVARPFLMPVVLAFFLAFLLKPAVRMLGKIRIHEGIGALIVMLAFFGVIGFGINSLIQPANEWISNAPETLHQVEGRFHRLMRPAAKLNKVAEQVENITQGSSAEEHPQKVEIKQSRLREVVFTYGKSLLAGMIEMIVLVYFLLASGDLFMHKLVRVLPTLHDKKKAVEIAHEVQTSISTFLFTIAGINTCLGILVGGTLYFLDLPNPALWGVMAALLNFIPYFGPLSGVVILALVGLVTYESPGRALLAPAIYLALHAIESNVITPMVLGRRLTLNPVVIFISLIFWTWLWGVPGALLSIPMLMMLKIFCDHFRPLAPVSEFLSG